MSALKSVLLAIRPSLTTGAAAQKGAPSEDPSELCGGLGGKAGVAVEVEERR